MAANKSSFEVPNRGRAQLVGTYGFGCILAAWLITQQLLSDHPSWIVVATFSFLIVVNGWLWLWRVVMKIDVNETKINLHTVRSKRTLDLASLHLVRPFSAMPFVQVFEFKKRGFYFVWAGFSSRQFFNTLRELRPDLQFRLATLTDDEEELLAEEKSKPTNTERKRAAKIAKANKKAK